MIFFLLLLMCILCAGLKVSGKNEFFTDYCAPKNTGTVNAIASVLIFLSHGASYLKLSGVYNAPYLEFRGFHSQLVVVTFLFFSGYGIMESIKKKGFSYVKKMPFHRLFKLWYHFVIVLVMYFAVQTLICDKRFSLKNILWSLTGYKSLGNSNWYMFATFAFYIIVIVSFFIARKSKVLGVALVVTLSAVLYHYEMVSGFQEAFFNTFLCFPLGVVFSMVKPYFDKLFMKNDVIWTGGLFLLLLSFNYFSENRNDGITNYVLFTFTAMFIFLLLMMKIKITSSVLDWFSGHVFSFFILQRIPMIILTHYGYTREPIAFIIISFFGTVCLATVFDCITDKLDGIIYKKREKQELKSA